MIRGGSISNIGRCRSCDASGRKRRGALRIGDIHRPVRADECRYGEVWFDVGGRQAMTRATTAEAALETIYSLAGVCAPPTREPVFRGPSARHQPRGAAIIFYVLWPVLVTSLAIAKAKAPAARARGRREAPRSGAPERARAGVGPREQ